MGDAHNLIHLHRESQSGQGRRHRQTSLNRAIIVVTVAAWQAYVQDMTQAVLDYIAVPHGHAGHSVYTVIKVATKNAIRRFNTPNAKNSVDLLLDAGFDPTPGWAFTIGQPPRNYAEAQIRNEVDAWLAVRHKIAHGAKLDPSFVISGQTQAGPSLRLKDAERCVEFFEAVVTAMGNEAATQFP